MTNQSPEAGFTLVELLIALLIFGMLSSAGVALLSFSVRTQDLADERLGALAEIGRAGALIASDLAQATARITRDDAGATHPAFEGGTGQDGGLAFALVRRGWENFDGAKRSSLQKVQYRIVDGRLERHAFRFVDGAPEMQPAIVLDGVRRVHLRYRDGEGQWRERWDPKAITDLPRAAEVVIERDREGSVRQLFLVGAGA